MESNNFQEENSKFGMQFKISQMTNTTGELAVCRIACIQLGAFKCSNRATSLWFNQFSVDFSRLSLLQDCQDAIKYLLQLEWTFFSSSIVNERLLFYICHFAIWTHLPVCNQHYASICDVIWYWFRKRMESNFRQIQQYK